MYSLVSKETSMALTTLSGALGCKFMVKGGPCPRFQSSGSSRVTCDTTAGGEFSVTDNCWDSTILGGLSFTSVTLI